MTMKVKNKVCINTTMKIKEMHMNTNILLGELAVSTTTSAVVCTSVDASPLLTALITFGVSLVTIVGGELIKFLVAFLKKKTQELDNQKKGNQENENKK